MKLNLKALTGIVRPYQMMDQMLKSQGFTRCHNLPPVYNMQVKDTVSGLVYRLKIPTSLAGKDTHVESLRLESPSLEISTLPNYYKVQSLIPESVVSAVNHKIEEVASYLRN